MASNVSGPSDKYIYIPDQEEEQNTRQAETSEEIARPTQEAIDEQNLSYHQALGFTDESRPGPPTARDAQGSTRLDYTPTEQEQNLQRLLARQQAEAARRADPPPSIDSPGLSENPADSPDLRPRQSTSRLRRAFSRQNLSRQPSQASLGALSNASTSSFGAIPSANASRINLRQGSLGRQGSGGDVPPVPALPAAFRQGTLTSQLSSPHSDQAPEGTVLREGEITSEPIPHEPPPTYNAAAGSSTGPGTLAGAAALNAPSRSRLRSLGNLITSGRTRDPQGDANNKLRQALEKGSSKDIAKFLNATSPAPNPATPSSENEQNAFHKVGLSKGNLSRETIDQLFEKTPVGLRAAASRAQDKLGRNTPLHLVQQQIGKLQALLINQNPAKIEVLEHMATKLIEADAAAPGETPLNQIRNAARRTPDEERREARRTASNGIF
jgi:hypothetical protein